MKIIADSSSLCAPSEGKELGVIIIPVNVIINGKSYRDYEEIQSDDFIQFVREGATPTSSQPAIGDVIEAFEGTEEEILFISIGDGLSGTYQNAVGAKNSIEDNEHIHVINTKTLAGALHYLVLKAVQLRDEGFTIEEIKQSLQNSIETSESYVIPIDLDFLKRSGRLTPVAAKIGNLIKIVPVLTQTTDKKRIKPFVIKRSRKKAVDAIIAHFQEIGVDENYIISVAHAGVQEEAETVKEQIGQHFPDTTIEMFQLCPALMTHGGPGCITIQVIKK
jgi:DegV family protein with EDD domain